MDQLRCTGTLSLVANENNVLKRRHSVSICLIACLSIVSLIFQIIVGDSLKGISFQMQIQIPTDSNKENESPENMRFDRINHFPEFDFDKSGGRCKQCRKTTHVYCSKCKKNLCFAPGKNGRNCFTPYHFKKNSNP